MANTKANAKIWDDEDLRRGTHARSLERLREDVLHEGGGW